ncbi:MAG TPA: TIGR03118 family protein [Terriglobales bacterium]|nr:TIGR03118 family protein [Terriglobales bacterium]
MLKTISLRRSLWVGSLLLALISLPAFAQHFTRTDLTSSVSGAAPNFDANLINGWGLSRATASPWWVSDAGKGVSTLYNAAGAPQSLVVAIPGLNGGPGHPTGTVFNYSSGFEAAPGAKSIFLFVTIEGTIAGWNPGVKPTEAVTLKDRKGKAVFTGCTLVTNRFGTFLYAANFKTGDIEVYDSKFKHVFDLNVKRHGASHGLNAFNVQNVGDNLVVTFAKPSPDGREVHAPGAGAVAIFSPFGQLLQRVDRGNFLNAPWGVAQTPSDFGVFSHRLLIGNLGDGHVSVFNTLTGNFEGQLKDATDAAIAIDGLWALSFGGNGASGSSIELYYTAGPNEGANGLFGQLVPVVTEQRGNNE